MSTTPPDDKSPPKTSPSSGPPIPPKWHEPSPPWPEEREPKPPQSPGRIALKVALWVLAVIVAVPVIGLLLLFGVCYFNAR
jgi:hypothetical protein